MRQDVEFTSAGLTLRGWLYRPDGADGDRPAVVMSHGFSAVKEQGLDGFAQRFCAAGMIVLAFDHRHLGSSEGDQRGRIVYQEQHDDTRAALGWLTQQPGVDTERVGLWGSSYSGAHAIFLGAFDPRVKVVAFCRNVCTTTSNASVAIAIVDSVMRMMAPPKTTATTAAARAERAIAGSNPWLALASTDGSSGSWAALMVSGIVTSAVV